MGWLGSRTGLWVAIPCLLKAALYRFQGIKAKGENGMQQDSEVLSNPHSGPLIDEDLCAWEVPNYLLSGL